MTEKFEMMWHVPVEIRVGKDVSSCIRNHSRNSIEHTMKQCISDDLGIVVSRLEIKSDSSLRPTEYEVRFRGDVAGRSSYGQLDLFEETGEENLFVRSPFFSIAKFVKTLIKKNAHLILGLSGYRMIGKRIAREYPEISWAFGNSDQHFSAFLSIVRELLSACISLSILPELIKTVADVSGASDTDSVISICMNSLADEDVVAKYRLAA